MTLTEAYYPPSCRGNVLYRKWREMGVLMAENILIPRLLNSILVPRVKSDLDPEPTHQAAEQMVKTAERLTTVISRAELQSFIPEAQHGAFGLRTGAARNYLAV